MDAYQQRVCDELKELGERRAKLDVFISTSAIFKTLPEDEQQRLINQLFIMGVYASILDDRIAHFREPQT